MRIIFAGTPETALPSLTALQAAGHEIVAVLTRADAPTGRGKKLLPSPVAARAAELGIEVLKPDKLTDAAFLSRFQELSPDICVVVAYGKLISTELLNTPRFGWINLHFSLLPSWRGAAPVQWSILAGEQVTGACVFQLEEGLDTGPVYRATTLPLSTEATSGEVLAELAKRGGQLLVDTLADIASGVAPEPQDHSKASAAPKITVAHAEIDFTLNAESIDRLIRAMNPEPGAWTILDGQRFKIYRAKPASGLRSPFLAAGELDYDKRHVWVGTGDGLLELLEVQPFSKRRMSAADWARGAQPGRCFFSRG